MSNSKYGNWTCSGRSWDTRRRGDIADFDRWFKKGRKVWVVNEHETRIAGQFEAHTCSLRTATGGGLFNSEGKSLLMTYGQAFETQPHGLRDLASPEPDCRDEGLYGIRRGEQYRGAIHRDDIKQMEYLADEAEERTKADKKSGARKGWW
ncbi:hypothetical protein [Streptomyces sp. NPDC002467]|uniref:hypothetical protein n=1 Tax=Streptomyces sp. NPDC002467 TaxID=3364647 RepID=UPI003681D2B9